MEVSAPQLSLVEQGVWQHLILISGKLYQCMFMYELDWAIVVRTFVGFHKLFGMYMLHS